MSLVMNTGMSRLTVTGTGWSNTSIDSGNGFTEEGGLLGDIAGDLGYDVGSEVDWDSIAKTEMPDMDWSDVVYTDKDGNLYTNPNGTGIWTDPLTGLEYPGGGDMWIPEDMLMDVSDILDGVSFGDQSLAIYSIPDDVIATLYGGKVSIETNYSPSDPARPHSYSPACWYIQQTASNTVLFLGEPFYHATANGGSITVFDEAFTTRDGSTKAIYYSDCTTTFSSATLPSPYNSFPIEYVAWQCVYGALDKTLVGKNENTISKDSILNGTSGLIEREINGQTFYKVNQ